MQLRSACAISKVFKPGWAWTHPPDQCVLKCISLLFSKNERIYCPKNVSLAAEGFNRCSSPVFNKICQRWWCQFVMRWVKGLCTIPALQLPQRMVLTLVSNELTLLGKNSNPHTLINIDFLFRLWQNLSFSPETVKQPTSVFMFSNRGESSKGKDQMAVIWKCPYSFYVLCNSFEERYSSSHIL